MAALPLLLPPVGPHQDYDCFYASVFEVENPALKGLPLCVQQKQIIVTCNYEARRRGLHKLQLIRDVKRICPDAVIVLGEDLTKFRDASKALYRFLRTYSWNGLVETLGFDEVFVDVTDIIEYNLALLNHAQLSASFFCLQRDDPTQGFAFDASSVAGHAYAPSHEVPTSSSGYDDTLLLRLILGSHLAHHMRMQMEQQMGYTSTVGISTSKLLSKLVGNVHKPRSQTTLLPPYASNENEGSSNVTTFMDAHDIGKIPGIGFKMSYTLQEYAMKRLGTPREDEMHVEPQPRITVGNLRRLPGVDAQVLEDVLAGPGMQRGVGFRTWCLLHGIDDSDVAQAKDTPKQISIEDSYLRMDSIEGVHHELLMLTTSLLRRMHADLTEEETGDVIQEPGEAASKARKWLAHPKTLRLSTRPRPPPGPDGKRGRASARISRSTSLPMFVFSFLEPVELLAQRLVHESLLGLFNQLHPERQGWDLSLINVAVTNMADAAGSSRTAAGRDISKMFRNQGEALQPWKVMDADALPTVGTDHANEGEATATETPAQDISVKGSEDNFFSSQVTHSSDAGSTWEEYDEDDQSAGNACPLCGAAMPDFAIPAHLRFHEATD